MSNPVRDYEWGSTTALARMQGRIACGRPEAELWMGAHPSAPSVLIGLDGTAQPLDVVLARAADAVLGQDVMARFGARLPFMLKVLAIARPLSLQVHPDAAQARSGWEAQQAADAEPPGRVPADEPGEAGLPQPHRYADPYPKPEMLYALEPVDALCGFRSPEQAARLVALLGCDLLKDVVAELSGPGSATQCLKAALETLVTWPAATRGPLVTDIAERARHLLVTAGSLREPGTLPPPDRRAFTWVARLAAAFPDDPLTLAPLLLDLVRIAPGETLYVPPGAPHAYLYGLGLEVLAGSDNVLRAGLTHKQVAVDELLRVVDPAAAPLRDVPCQVVGPSEVIWRPPVAEFLLSRIRPTQAPTSAYPHLSGPQVLFCTRGPVTVSCGRTSVVLRPGESAFLGASGGPLELTGPGEVFRALVGATSR